MKKDEEVKVKSSIVSKILAKLGIKSLDEVDNAKAVDNAGDSVKAMELSTADGQTITVDREEGEPQVGDTASPDGTFEMPDGKTITVADGVITDIQTGDGEDEGSADGDGADGSGDEGADASASVDAKQVKVLQAKVATLTEERDDLKAKLEKAEKMAKSKEDLQVLNAVKMAGGAKKVLGSISSHYKPAGRTPSGKNVEDKSDRETDKEAIIAKLEEIRSKKAKK